MSKAKVFTYDEFNERVKFFWELMVKPDFPNKECPPIQHDIHKRKTNNLGMAHYKPIKLSFSYQLLDGRYLLEDVDNVIKHEIGHLYCYFKYDKGQGHNSNFKKIAKKFGFSGTCGIDMRTVDGVIDYPTPKKPKYRVYCPVCDYEDFRVNKSNIIKHPNDYICPCGHHGMKVEVL